MIGLLRRMTRGKILFTCGGAHLYSHAMDSVRSLIVARVAELGLSLSELSLRAGKNHAYFQQFIKRGIPDRLPEEVRGLVARILRVDEAQLKMVGKKSTAPA